MYFFVVWMIGGGAGVSVSGSRPWGWGEPKVWLAEGQTPEDSEVADDRPVYVVPVDERAVEVVPDE